MSHWIIEMPEGCVPQDCRLCGYERRVSKNMEGCNQLGKAVKAVEVNSKTILWDDKDNPEVKGKLVKLWATEEKQ